MFDMTQPVSINIIVGSIIFIFGLIGTGLGVINYYKKKQDKIN